MITLPFKLHLVTDAEPGSGLGGALINQLVTRDHLGRVVIRSTHLKGLMRQRLRDLLPPLLAPNEYEQLDALVFGREGVEGDEGVDSALRISDATLSGEAESATHLITRTALSDHGVVLGGSLRSTEAIASGSRFHGTLSVEDGYPEVVSVAAKLALLSISSVGSKRTRGSGRCYFELESPDTPGALLRALMKLRGAITAPSVRTAPAAPKSLSDRPIEWLKLTFEAESPICCPTRPTLGLNVISSGSVIPASAVQGALLNRLSQVDDALASACFESDRFRVWPLAPDSPLNEPASGGIPVRVSLTHRMSKLADSEGQHTFKDVAIEPYDWRDIPSGAPLKSSDGFLISSGQEVSLWKSAHLPRLLTAHGVHHDGQGDRNLFTVESIAPLRWVGLVAGPPEAIEALCESIARQPQMRLGKARSVRGSGHLSAERCDPPRLDQTTWIVQSPLEIPDSWEIGRAERCLEQLVSSAGWGEVTAAWAKLGVRFGWNRSQQGTRVGSTNRIRAARCVAEGSVFTLQSHITHEQLVRGIGSNSAMAMGALLPHPGVATRAQVSEVDLPRRSSRQEGRFALSLFKRSGAQRLSPSQISALIRAEKTGRGREYFDRQRDRSVKVWEKWEYMIEALDPLFEENTHVIIRALEGWRDLVKAAR